jgi:predicted transcriptional regulator
MFDKCISCERLGQDCVPNLFELSWPDLLEWWKKRQKHLGWTNQVLSDKSKVPLGTINRIKAGEDDCKYSTMRMILHALTGGYDIEFPCQKKLDAEFAHIETLEKQCTELASANEGLVGRLQIIEETHRKDILAITADYKERIEFLKENNEFLRKQLEWYQEHKKE